MADSSTTSIPPDADLVVRVRDGDDRALAAIYDRYASMVYSVARAVTGRDIDAEEVAEDVFLHLWRKPQQFDPERGSLPTYLALVARSRARDRVRARRRRRSAEERSAAADPEELAAPLSNPGDDPSERLRREEARRRLDPLLGMLNEGQREAIELAYLGGYTQSEIAERLDTPLGTVKTRIRDGMAKMRESLRAERRA